MNKLQFHVQILFFEEMKMRQDGEELDKQMLSLTGANCIKNNKEFRKTT